MSVRRPTLSDVEELAARFDFELTRAEIEECWELVDRALRAYDWLDEAADDQRDRDDEVDGHVRKRPGHRPTEAENPLGAWYWKTEIKGRTDGALSSRTVVVKDNICVAGIPMMHGSAVLDGYVPERDATVVQRVLAAGGVIVGKAVCESLSRSGGSHTSDTGPVRNPYDRARSSGGSTSGCAALLASGVVDLAIGGDQGGSIRVPSSWCGVYGLKPTYGLVPYTGAFPLEMTLDHLGPMARTTADVATLLDVIAGVDGLDPRQCQAFGIAGDRGSNPVSYHESLAEDIAGLRFATVREGFEWPGLSEHDVDAAVRAGADLFETLGASVSEVSVPWHRDAGNIARAIGLEGPLSLMMHGEGVGSNWKGYYSTSMLQAFALGRRRRGRMFPPTVKVYTLAAQWMRNEYHGYYYAKAQNLSRQLCNLYDRALGAVDVLILPTTPMKATVLPPPDASMGERVRCAMGMGVNTMPFNVTGHPAMSIPCAMSNGLPVGMMLVGRRGDDAAVLRAAHAFEKNFFPPPLPPTRAG